MTHFGLSRSMSLNGRVVRLRSHLERSDLVVLGSEAAGWQDGVSRRLLNLP